MSLVGYARLEEREAGWLQVATLLECLGLAPVSTELEMGKTMRGSIRYG